MSGHKTFGMLPGAGFSGLPVTIRVAQGAPVTDGVHVLAQVDVPDLLGAPAYLVFDSNRGHIALTVDGGGSVHVELSAMLLRLAQGAGAAAPATSRIQ